LITAIVLAAGESQRMGRPKLTLPWGNTTVLGQVVITLAAADLEDILVVTGGARRELQPILDELRRGHRLRRIHNNGYAQGEMLSSLQCGLTSLKPEVEAALVTLGDQPQIQKGTVRRILDVYRQTGKPLIVPSFQMRRGHPWLVSRSLWPDIMRLTYPQSSRDFLNTQASAIHYLNVETPTVLQDLDTPEDYQRFRKDQ
jgi:molybdenum cofactor cytidylyltransferase